MLRSVASKVVWMARAATTVVGLAIMLALVFGVATAAFGANNDNFILGSLNNTATALTKLTGNVNGSTLQVVNNNADANDSALSLSVQSGEAPMKVNSSKVVTNLNADRLDGNNSTAFLPSEIYTKSTSQTIPANNFDNGITLYCDSRDVAVSGSYRIAKPGAYLQIFGEERVDERFDEERGVVTPSGWHVYVDNPDADSEGTITVFVHCADRPPLHQPNVP